MGTNEYSQPASKSSWDSQDFGDVNMVVKMAHFHKSSRPQWVNCVLVAVNFTCTIQVIFPVPAKQLLWWRHLMETFSALLALCVRNSPVTGEFPSQGPGTRSFVVFFDLRLNKRLSKQSIRWRFETPSGSLWRNCNVEEFRTRMTGLMNPTE